MKVNGIVNGQSVNILLASDRFHNFIDSKLLRCWGHQAHSTQAFEVMIADGGKVKSLDCCKSATLSLRGYNCHVNLYSPSLGSCDAVLGLQWLTTVSLVLWDFQLLTMEFTRNHLKYKLYHNPPTEPLTEEVSLQHLDKEIYNSNLGLFLYFMKGKRIEACDLVAHQLQELQHIFGDFEEIFKVPSLSCLIQGFMTTIYPWYWGSNLMILGLTIMGH